MKKLISFLFLSFSSICIFKSNSCICAQSTADHAKIFINQIGTELIKALSNPQDIETARKMLKDHVDLTSIAKFVIGKEYFSQIDPNNGTTSDEKTKRQNLLTQYLQAFENHLLKLYTRVFSQYKIVNMDVKKSVIEHVGSKDYVFVTSIVTTQSGLPYETQWILEPIQGQNKFNIIDVKVNGLSLRINQKSEFEPLLKSSKSIEDFINKLK